MFVANDVFLLSTICMKPYIHKKLLESYNLIKIIASHEKNNRKCPWNSFQSTQNILVKRLPNARNSYKSFNSLLLPQFAKHEILEEIFCPIKLFSQLDEGTLQLKQRMSGIFLENILLRQAKYNGNGNILI